MEPANNKLLARTAVVIAAGYVAVLAAMVISVALGTPAGATIDEQLAALAADSRSYRVGFAFASLVPVFALALTALAPMLAPPSPGAEPLARVGRLFLAAYAPVSAVAYASQYTLLPVLLREGSPAARLCYFNSPDSAALTLDMLAYALFGFGALFISIPLASARGAWRWAAGFLIASGVTSIAAFPAYVVGAPASVQLSMISGVLTLPFAVIVLAVAWRAARREPAGAVVGLA